MLRAMLGITNSAASQVRHEYQLQPFNILVKVVTIIFHPKQIDHNIDSCRSDRGCLATPHSVAWNT